jgi:hypothetical protein
VNPYMKSRQIDSRGIDMHPLVQVALGDMHLYLWSVCHALDIYSMPKAQQFPHRLRTVEEAVCLLSLNFAAVLSLPCERNVIVSLTSLSEICRMCAVDPRAAIESSMEKLK